MGFNNRSRESESVTSHFLTKRKEPKKFVKMPKGGGLTKPMQVSDDLAAIIGVEEASRAECVKHLWAYLKENNLQCEDNKQFFLPDKKMAKIFGNDKLRAFSMSKFLGAHLTPIDE